MKLNPKLTAAAKAGFTLVELVVVVLILAILAGVIVPVIGDKVDQSRLTAAKATMKEISNAFNHYHIDTGSWPSNTPTSAKITTKSEDLYGYTCFYNNTGNRTNWNGPYLNDGVMSGTTMNIAVSGQTTGLLDAWQQPFRVMSFAEGYSSGQGAIVLLCRGPNGTLDTSQAQAYAGTPQKDDMMYVTSRKLSVGSQN